MPNGTRVSISPFAVSSMPPWAAPLAVSFFSVRSPATRWASIAFGAGLGLGSAYTECSRLFDGSPAKFATPKITETPASQDQQD
nr:uncharacterized protein LOC112489423 isoform X3 [Ziziphus jujuba var. spinosa]